MDELDKLKSHWKKSEDTFPQVSESDIHGMLHKKSSSEVKWILIISILEFVFWGLGSLVTSFVNEDYSPSLFIEVIDYANYAILIVFIALFYINFRKISSEKPVKKLMQNIIRVRSIVKFYVVYMIIMIAFGLVSGLLMYDDSSMGDDKTPVLIVGFVFIPVVIILILFVYNLLYGRLLKNLNKNYIELKKIKEQ